jgi:hypothetical protein
MYAAERYTETPHYTNQAGLLMRRIVTFSMAVFITPAAIVFSTP